MSALYLDSRRASRATENTLQLLKRKPLHLRAAVPIKHHQIQNDIANNNEETKDGKEETVAMSA